MQHHRFQGTENVKSLWTMYCVTSNSTLSKVTYICMWHYFPMKLKHTPPETKKNIKCVNNQQCNWHLYMYKFSKLSPISCTWSLTYLFLIQRVIIGQWSCTAGNISKHCAVWKKNDGETWQIFANTCPDQSSWDLILCWTQVVLFKAITLGTTLLTKFLSVHSLALVKDHVHRQQRRSTVM
jgi:hypothetical protein